jgi:hypothetical protein
MNPPRRKQRGIAERGFAPMTAGGIHPRSKLRGIEPSQLNLLQMRPFIRSAATYGTSHPPTVSHPVVRSLMSATVV